MHNILLILVIIIVSITTTACTTKPQPVKVIPIQVDDRYFEPCAPADILNHMNYRQLEMYSVTLLNVLESCNLDKETIKRMINRQNGIRG